MEARINALREARNAIATTQDEMASWSSAETARWLQAWGGDGPSVAEWLAVQMGMGRAVRILDELIDGSAR